MTRFQTTLLGRIEKDLLFFHTDQLWMSLSWSAYLRSPERRRRAPGPAQSPTPCLWDWIPAACSGLPQSSESHPSLKDGCSLHHTLSLALKVKNENNWSTCGWKKSRQTEVIVKIPHWGDIFRHLWSSCFVLDYKGRQTDKRHYAFKILCMVPILFKISSLFFLFYFLTYWKSILFCLTFCGVILWKRAKSFNSSRAWRHWETNSHCSKREENINLCWRLMTISLFVLL